MGRLGALKAGMFFNGNISRNSGQHERAKIRGSWKASCFNPNGDLKWEDVIDPNLVVNAGLNYLLDVGLSSGTQYGFWNVGLVSTFTYPSGAAGDTMASHASWTEFQNYSETVRQQWIDGGVASQSIDNSASKATFTISQDAQTVTGAFLVGGVNSDAKAIGSGTLYAVGAFTQGAKSVNTNDSLHVTATFTSADDQI